MKKGKNKNKNVLNRLGKEINQKANPIYNKKSKVANYDKEMQEAKESKSKLKSKIEANNGLEDYMHLIKMTDKDFSTNKEDVPMQLQTVGTISIVPINQSNNILLNGALKNSKLDVQSQVEFLSIPKRPKWTKGISKENFEKMEREAFLAWRKALAIEEEKRIDMSITPFEKNMEVWKQLWLVVDKCKLLFQIVDGRNPLYFRCPDLDDYVKSVDPNKEVVLIVNKSDLMSEPIRKNWADYFEKNGIKYVFFSALEELEKVETGDIENEAKDNAHPKEEKDDKDNYKIYNRNDLVKFMKNELEKLNNSAKEKDLSNFIGFIGYPNVGKSSIINVLMKTKKVGVAMMPGKTKHYQTLFLPEESSLNIEAKSICLMDCPGLVFPSFTSSKADMLVNGIYPIDTIKDYHSPIQIIIQRIPPKVFNKFYRVQLPDIYSAKQFLQVLAEKRGFYTGAGLPDEAKTARIVLKDYVSGKLLYCYLRPDYTEEKFGFIQQYENIELTEKEKEQHKMIESIPATFDENYEKLYYENEQVLENKKVKEADGNFDDDFFGKETQKNNKNEDETQLITKNMKKELKFAWKRGDITEDEYLGCETTQEYNEIMERVKKNKSDKNSKELIKTRGVNF